VWHLAIDDCQSAREIFKVILLVLSVRVSRGTSEIQTASDASVKTASLVSEVESEVIAADDQSVQRGAAAISPVPSESARTAVDSSALDSSLSSVHTSPSLQPQQPTVEPQKRPSISDHGLFSFCVDSDNVL